MKSTIFYIFNRSLLGTTKCPGTLGSQTKDEPRSVKVIFNYHRDTNLFETRRTASLSVQDRNDESLLTDVSLCCDKNFISNVK